MPHSLCIHFPFHVSHVSTLCPHAPTTWYHTTLALPTPHSVSPCPNPTIPMPNSLYPCSILCLHAQLSVPMSHSLSPCLTLCPVVSFTESICPIPCIPISHPVFPCSTLYFSHIPLIVSPCHNPCIPMPIHVSMFHTMFSCSTLFVQFHTPVSHCHIMFPCPPLCHHSSFPVSACSTHTIPMPHPLSPHVQPCSHAPHAVPMLHHFVTMPHPVYVCHIMIPMTTPVYPMLICLCTNASLPVYPCPTPYIGIPHPLWPHVTLCHHAPPVSHAPLLCSQTPLQVDMNITLICRLSNLVEPIFYHLETNLLHTHTISYHFVQNLVLF